MEISRQFDGKMDARKIQTMYDELRKLGEIESLSINLFYDQEIVRTTTMEELGTILSMKGTTSHLRFSCGIKKINKETVGIYGEIGKVYIDSASSHKHVFVTLELKEETGRLNALFDHIIKIFELKPYLPAEESGVKKNIFLGHAFDEKGKIYAYELTQFFTLLGFKVTSGQKYSPEKISNKIKKCIEKGEVAVIVWSKKEDYTWLTQESAGATFLDKPLILLVEEGVEMKSGVLGDIETIKFPEGDISKTFIPMLEGLSELGYL